MSDTMDLTYLIRNMNPVLLDGEFIFCKVNIDSKKIHELEPISSIKTGKEYSIIIDKLKADKNRFGYNKIYKMVSLKLPSNHSEAEFMAVITGVFADQGIPSKVISCEEECYLFISTETIEDAVQLLHDLTVDF